MTPLAQSIYDLGRIMMADRTPYRRGDIMAMANVSLGQFNLAKKHLGLTKSMVVTKNGYYYYFVMPIVSPGELEELANKAAASQPKVRVRAPAPPPIPTPTYKPLDWPWTFRGGVGVPVYQAAKS